MEEAVALEIAQHYFKNHVQDALREYGYHDWWHIHQFRRTYYGCTCKCEQWHIEWGLQMRLEIYHDNSKNGWRWRSIDSNGRIIADGSESYVSKQNAIRALQNVVTEMREATIYVENGEVNNIFDESGKAGHENRKG